MSVHLLVQVEALPAWRITGIFCALMQIPGVQMVTDLATTSQVTLDAILLKPTPALEREEPEIYNAIRRHHQRRQQPELALDGEAVAKPKRRKARVA